MAHCHWDCLQDWIHYNESTRCPCCLEEYDLSPLYTNNIVILMECIIYVHAVMIVVILAIKALTLIV